ncbi:MAG: hypothetical protein LWX11_07460, partial [Firmicutes bacterium]|nr:hypothetical protein [Bacillota bacterium]
MMRRFAQSAWMKAIGLLGLLILSAVGIEILLAWTGQEAHTKHTVVRFDDGSRLLMALFGAWLMHVRLKSDAGPLHSFWCRMRLAFLLKVASLVYVFLVSDLWELEGGILFARHALYLAALLCLGWALAALPTRPGELGHRSSGYLDGLMISLALFIIAWGTFIKRLVDTHADGGGSYVFTLVYPILAVTLLALWFFQESRRVVGLSNGERRLIGAGFLSITLFYGIFAVLSIT